ncbi:MAG: hypothetical protein C0467_29530 [Planctomycetaceae bacterium]|nr:hypothetical protein [Planctomycetaceae bacterium]
MFHLLGSIGLAYVAGTGIATNAAVIGRGLVRAARTAVDGEYGEAAVEVLGSLAAPALMCYGSITGLCRDVVAVAQELAGPVLGEVFEEPTPREWAA